MKTFIAVFLWAGSIAAGVYGVYADIAWLLPVAFIIGFPSGFYWGFRVV